MMYFGDFVVTLALNLYSTPNKQETQGFYVKIT